MIDIWKKVLSMPEPLNHLLEKMIEESEGDEGGFARALMDRYDFFVEFGHDRQAEEMLREFIIAQLSPLGERVSI